MIKSLQMNVFQEIKYNGDKRRPAWADWNRIIELADKTII